MVWIKKDNGRKERLWEGEKRTSLVVVFGGKGKKTTILKRKREKKDEISPPPHPHMQWIYKQSSHKQLTVLCCLIPTQSSLMWRKNLQITLSQAKQTEFRFKNGRAKKICGQQKSNNKKLSIFGFLKWSSKRKWSSTFDGELKKKHAKFHLHNFVCPTYWGWTFQSFKHHILPEHWLFYENIQCLRKIKAVVRKMLLEQHFFLVFYGRMIHFFLFFWGRGEGGRPQKNKQNSGLFAQKKLQNKMLFKEHFSNRQLYFFQNFGCFLWTTNIRQNH